MPTPQAVRKLVKALIPPQIGFSSNLYLLGVALIVRCVWMRQSTVLSSLILVVCVHTVPGCRLCCYCREHKSPKDLVVMEGMTKGS